MQCEPCNGNPDWHQAWNGQVNSQSDESAPEINIGHYAIELGVQNLPRFPPRRRHTRALSHRAWPPGLMHGAQGARRREPATVAVLALLFCPGSTTRAAVACAAQRLSFGTKSVHCALPHGPLAQSVEQLAFNQLVAGSNPARPTIHWRWPRRRSPVPVACRCATVNRQHWAGRARPGFAPLHSRQPMRG